ncbi:MAG: peptidylprolyl isomerase, partial [Planctomycetota bacterium]
APTSTRETIARLCPPRAQVAIWLSDDAAMHKAFERLLSLSPDNDAVTIAWAREAVASADYEVAIDLLQRRKIEGPRAVQAHLLRATALLGINRFTDAQAVLNTAPMARQPDEAVQIGEMSARITKLNDVWAKELSAISRDQNGEPLPTVELLTSKGPVLLELFEEDVPFTVRNFVERVESGAYDGTRFHRLQRGFAIQGGDPETVGGGAGGKGTGGWLIPDEIEPNTARAPLFGRLVMAKQALPQDPANPAPNTAGSQFAILLSTSEHVAEKFTVFGRVIDGWDAARELVAGDEIVQARVLTKRDHAYEAVRLPDAPAPYTFPRPAPPRVPPATNPGPAAAPQGVPQTLPLIKPVG